MKRKHTKILALIFQHPLSGGIKWTEIESLLLALGAELEEGEGSRVSVYLFGEQRMFHRPHPSPDMDKGAIAALRRWLEENGVLP